MEYGNVYRTDELTHWGIKGMKWGIRRYQNKDGSLTAAGKKRRAQLEGELEKLGGKKDNSDAAASVRKKTVGEMSNKELQEYTTRMQLEKNYYDAQKQLATANPKQVSRGQKIAEKFINEAIVPAATNAGKAYLEKMMKEKMGINTEDPVAALKKTWEKLDYEQKIDKIRNPDKYLSEEDRTKRADRQYKAEDRAAKMEGYNDAADKAAKQREAKIKADREAAAEARPNFDAMSRASLNNSPRRTVSRIDSNEYDLEYTTKKADSGRSFVDSKGDTLFTVPDKTRDAGRSFVDSRGNVLFTWSDDK